MFDLFSGKKGLPAHFGRVAANLQIINFIHSQPFVQMLFRCDINKRGGGLFGERVKDFNLRYFSKISYIACDKDFIIYDGGGCYDCIGEFKSIGFSYDNSSQFHRLIKLISYTIPNKIVY